MSDKNRIDKYADGIVTTDNGVELSPSDDDYKVCKSELDSITNPLSDDYNKYDNE